MNKAHKNGLALTRRTSPPQKWRHSASYRISGTDLNFPVAVRTLARGSWIAVGIPILRVIPAVGLLLAEFDLSAANDTGRVNDQARNQK